MKLTKDKIIKAKTLKDNESIPLLDCFYIIGTEKTYDNGFQIMEIVGYSKKHKFLKKLNIYCDIVNFDGGFSLDIDSTNSLIRCFAPTKKIKVIWHAGRNFITILVDEKEEK